MSSKHFHEAEISQVLITLKTCRNKWEEWRTKLKLKSQRRGECINNFLILSLGLTRADNCLKKGRILC